MCQRNHSTIQSCQGIIEKKKYIYPIEEKKKIIRKSATTPADENFLSLREIRDL